MSLSSIVSKLASWKAALNAVDFDALKAFGQPRLPQVPPDASNRLKPIQRSSPSRALVPSQEDRLPRLFHASDVTVGRFEAFDERATMETWSLPVDRVNDIYTLAMVGLVVGAIMTIAATVVLIWTSGIKSRYADENLSRALVLSDQAKAETARANERAAEFLLRAQQTSLEQEKARLEIEQVHKLNAPRRISAEQHAKIVKVLQGHPALVTLLSGGDDPEAAQFAEDIFKTLTDAGVTVNVSKSFLPIPIRGLGITMSTSQAAPVLYMAFRGAGFVIKDLPEKDPVMIVVGSKPPAF